MDALLIARTMGATFASHDILQFCFFFFFNDTATTEIYTLSLHDALPISGNGDARRALTRTSNERLRAPPRLARRSEEHTSELQSPCNLVCRLLLEKKKKISQLHLMLTRVFTRAPLHFVTRRTLYLFSCYV